MNLNYEVVPNIISSKDLDYLSDMFNWNYGAYKANLSASESVQDEVLKKIITKCYNTFHSSMNKVLEILNNGGSNE